MEAKEGELGALAALELKGGMAEEMRTMVAADYAFGRGIGGTGEDIEEDDSELLSELSHFYDLEGTAEETEKKEGEFDKTAGERTVEEPAPAPVPYPQASANPFSRIFFGYAGHLVWKGRWTLLNEPDIWQLRPEDRPEVCFPAFEECWQSEIQNRKHPRLLRTLVKTFGGPMLLGLFLWTIASASMFVGPLVLSRLIDYVSFKDDVRWKGFMYVGLLVSGFLGGSLCRSHAFIRSWRVAIRVRGALFQAIYRKSLRLSSAARQQDDTGRIVNLMANDAQRVFESIAFSALGFFAPMQITITLILLYVEIRYYVFVAFGVVIVVVFFNSFISKRMMSARQKMIKETDKRLKVLNEILQGIRSIKYYAWEKSFVKRITKIRAKELGYLRSMLGARSVVIWAFFALPTMILVITFVVYTKVGGNDLTVQKAFTVLALFGILRMPLAFLPMMIGLWVQARVSIKRLTMFLVREEIETLEELHERQVLIHQLRDKAHSLREKELLEQLEDEADSEKATKELELIRTEREEHERLTSDASVLCFIRDGYFKWVEPEPLEKPKKERKRFICCGKVKGADKKKKAEEESVSVSSEGAPLLVEMKEEKELEELETAEATSGEENAPEGDKDGKNVKEQKSKKKRKKKKLTHAEMLETATLQDINMVVRRGQLVAVVGATASGKSTLVSALIGDIHCIQGELVLRNRISYVAQSAWIINATVRQNILMGRQLDSERYRTVLDLAQLTSDLLLIPGGDKAEIGEKGINLSGGQKQRISIARAIYQEADLYIFDDPLSAVDPHVARSLFENAVRHFLSGKTVIIVTNQLHFVPQCDWICFIDRKTIAEQGTYDELMERGGGFSDLLTNFGGVKEEQKEDSGMTRDVAKDDSRAVGEKGLELIQEEEREIGAVSKRVYVRYVLSSGSVLLFLLALFFIYGGQGLQMSLDWWLSRWALKEGDRSLDYYLIVYSSLAFGVLTFALLNTQNWVVFGVRSGARFHRRLLASVIHAPTRFFESTPTGRILNRFSRDIDEIDLQLPIVWSSYIQSVGVALSVILVMSFAFPYILVAVIPVALFYYNFQKFYRVTGREIQRLESVSRSPLYAFFSETLTGASTIRAFKEQERFSERNLRMIDTNARLFFALQVCNQWFATHLDIIGVSLLTIVTLSIVVFRSYIDPGLAGLSIAYSLGIVGCLQWMSQTMAEAEIKMNAVERVLRYTRSIPQEAPPVRHRLPKAGWPSFGQVEFRNLSMTYRPEYDPVLRDLSFTVLPGEKIGVVGRTGAGKSSLLVALFRLVEPLSGSIYVDGVDIRTLDLGLLRSSFTIISQDPVLFSGTLRSNLDPFDEYSDARIWQVLELVQMKESTTRKKLKLKCPVTENGENFSQGEKQLICLGRALLRRSKVLVLDEATSSVDTKADALIQRTVRTEFADCTMLTIAHRLNTIMDSNRVLVMKDGKVAEFDKPSVLLDDPNSVFSSMVEETGAASAEHLRKIARGEIKVFDLFAEKDSKENSVKAVEPDEELESTRADFVGSSGPSIIESESASSVSSFSDNV